MSHVTPKSPKSPKSKDPAEFLVTLGDASQLEGILEGKFLQGCTAPRVAIVGRSNVGKSSLINAMLKKRLAQTSAEPGKTRCIHFYRWPVVGKVVADLPGYGYAKAGHSERERWANFIRAYLNRDTNLESVIVLLDARHGPTELDLEAIDFLASRGLPLHFVFAKADTLKTQSERALRRREGTKAVEALGYPIEAMHWVSAKTGDGLLTLVDFLSKSAPVQE